MLKHFLLSLALATTTYVSYAATPPAAKPAAKGAESANVAEAAKHVILHTSLGDIELELLTAKAPKTVDNFMQYVDSGFYNGTVFHRVIPGFMIQGGGFTKDLQQKRARAPIRNEASNGLSNLKYTVAMARTGDPHSASAQFFINLADNKRLDFTADTNSLTWGYCVFGKVTKGQDVVDKIAAIPTGPAGPLQADVPTTTVTIDKVEVVQ